MSGYVYRAFDCHGRLLYIGSTANPVERLHSHSCNARTTAKRDSNGPSDWFTYTGAITLDRFDTLAQAREAEAESIFEEMPHFNIRGRNPAHPHSGSIRQGHREAFMATGLHDCRLTKTPAA